MAAAVGTLLSGCLGPGDLDLSPLSLYQRELAALGPQRRSGDPNLGLYRPLEGPGPTLKLEGDPNAPAVVLGLKEAILRAVAQNADVRVVSFDPEISRQQTIEAAAAFDAIVNVSYQQGATHEEQRLASSPTRTNSRVLKAGVRQLTPTGGTYALNYTLTRIWDNSLFADPATAYQPTVVLEVGQPLLRDAWPEFNLSRLRIAQVNEKVSRADFRLKVEQIVSDTITAYWALWQARSELAIREDLLRSTRETLEKVKLRSEIDAAAAEVSQTEASVAQREVLVADARKAVEDAQDGLRKLLADPQLNLLNNVRIDLASLPAQAKVSLDAASQLQAALEHNPDLEKARLAITLADLNIVVARNQALPRLDLTGSVGYSGMDRRRGEAHENLGTMDFADYSMGLAFEYPPGNRERLAEVERRRFERLKAVAQLQSIADQIAVAVKERVREVERTYQEIGLQRSSAEALGRQLQALEDIEKIRGKLTPEFLNLKLNTQSTLADTRIAELRTIRAYNQALAELARATGTILKEHQVDILLPAAAGRAPWPEGEDRPAPATGAAGTPSVGQGPRRVWSGARLQAPE